MLRRTRDDNRTYNGNSNGSDLWEGLVGDLPADGGLGEGGFGGYLTGCGPGHLGEGGLNVVTHGPDGHFLHGIAVGDGGLFETVVDGNGSRAVDAGDLAVSVAEAGRVAGSGWSDRVAADTDALLDGLLEKKRLDQRIHLFGLRGIAGLEGEASVAEEAVGVVEEVIVDGQGEVR